MPTLKSAANFNNIEVATLCIQRGDDVNEMPQDGLGYSALHTCANFSSVEVATLLLQNGANVDIQSSASGNTPLHTAISHGHARFARFLVQNGANRLLENNEGRTPQQAHNNNELIALALETDSPHDWQAAIEVEQQREQQREQHQNIMDLLDQLEVEFRHIHGNLMHRVVAGEIHDMEQLLAEIEILQAQQAQAQPLAHNEVLQPAPVINDGQSTHNASVHQAVSKSAERLAERYQLMIDRAGLENVILRIQSYVDRLSDDSEKNQAAKRCIRRITDQSYTYTDRSSQITTRQLLALTFLAIGDDGNRVGTLEDARTKFVEGLYEIQRGYNLSDTGVDQGGQDGSICSAGTFNKLIEKLQGIHPDCQIIFITRETASLKLPIVVREEAMRYMELLADPNTAQKFRAFTQLVSQVKKHGVEVIWDQIKGNVANRMFDEFSSLYRDRADHSFTGLIEAGQYTELPDLSIFQKQVQSSEGYHQFCSQMLSQSNMFFTDRTSSEYPSEHRHDSTEVQMQYDWQFGLVFVYGFLMIGLWLSYRNDSIFPISINTISGNYDYRP